MLVTRYVRGGLEGALFLLGFVLTTDTVAGLAPLGVSRCPVCSETGRGDRASPWLSSYLVSPH